MSINININNKMNKKMKWMKIIKAMEYWEDPNLRDLWKSMRRDYATSTCPFSSHVNIKILLLLLPISFNF